MRDVLLTTLLIGVVLVVFFIFAASVYDAGGGGLQITSEQVLELSLIEPAPRGSCLNVQEIQNRRYIWRACK